MKVSRRVQNYCQWQIDISICRYSYIVVKEFSLCHLKSFHSDIILVRNKYYDRVNPVYKGHSMQPENVAFIYRVKLYALFITRRKQNFPL